MSCDKAARLNLLVTHAINDRNSFARKLSRQRKEPTERQLTELRRLQKEITDSNENLTQHEASCETCIGEPS